MAAFYVVCASQQAISLVYSYFSTHVNNKPLQLSFMVFSAVPNLQPATVSY